MMTIVGKLLLAHILTDFYLQPGGWVEDKRAKRERSPALLWHVLLTAGLAWLLLFSWSYWWIALIILVSHYAIDLGKVYLGKDDALSFLLDQGLHLLVILACGAMADEATRAALVQFWRRLSEPGTLAILLAYLFITRPSGFFVGIATAHWRRELEESTEEQLSLAKAGSWIGMLERTLVLTFVLLGQYSAIGLLVAAKSILRFSDKEERSPRKQTEYVLIGTLISFTIALGVGLLVRHIAPAAG